MAHALELARGRLGRTSPNPAVGCLIVNRGFVVGIGATAPGGRPHAETQALAMARGRARGATAYVSLEPCCHRAVTAPCAQALIDAGIRRVVVGCTDPYPAVNGGGIAMLRRAGVRLSVGVMEEECRQLNQGFFTRVAKGRPFGLLKLALSLDGRIATARGDSRWISSEPSRELVHRWRAECDAVVVGAGTVVADNPRLTCRIKGGRDPVRVIVDARLRSSPAARVFRQRSSAPAIVVTSSSSLARARRRYGSRRVELLGVAPVRGELPMASVMRLLGERGWNKVLFEGGAHLAASALRAGVIDHVAFFIAPRILGGGLPAIEGLRFDTMRESLALKAVTARPVGADWLLEADL